MRAYPHRTWMDVMLKFAILPAVLLLAVPTHAWAHTPISGEGQLFIGSLLGIIVVGLVALGVLVSLICKAFRSRIALGISIGLSVILTVPVYLWLLLVRVCFFENPQFQGKSWSREQMLLVVVPVYVLIGLLMVLPGLQWVVYSVRMVTSGGSFCHA
jgi:hypothetical protein